MISPLWFRDWAVLFNEPAATAFRRLFSQMQSHPCGLINQQGSLLLRHADRGLPRLKASPPVPHPLSQL